MTLSRSILSTGSFAGSWRQFLSHGFQSSLNRATVISSPASQPRVIMLARLTLFGAGATRLHGEIIPITATWSDTDRSKKPLRPLKERGEDLTLRELEEGLKLGRQPADAIVKRVTATAVQDIADLSPALEDRAQEIVARESKELEKIGLGEASSLRSLLHAQRKRIAETEQKARQFRFDFDAEGERKQHELDRKHWAKKVTQLEQDIVEQPEKIVDAYRSEPTVSSRWVSSISGQRQTEGSHDDRAQV